MFLHCLLSVYVVNFDYLIQKRRLTMDIRRWILAIILPPAAITNKEAGTIMLTGLLTLLGWLPGVVFAVFMMLQEKRQVSI